MEKRPNTQSGEGTPKNNRQEPISRFKTQFNPNYNGIEGSIQDSISQTVPDMSLTIRELVANHSRGIIPEINQPNPEYFDTEIPTIRDLTDLDALRDANKAWKDEIDQEIKQIELKAAEAAKIKDELPNSDPNNKTPLGV
jgi:hypothetical protein